MNKPISIGILTACDCTARGLTSLFDELHCEVIRAEHASELHVRLRTASLVLTLLVADMPNLDDAVALASLAQISVAIIAPTLGSAVHIYDDPRISGLLIQPFARAHLADLLATVLIGKRYRPALSAPSPTYAVPAGLSLTPREHALLQLQLHGCSLEETALVMRIEVESVRKYERRIRQRLRALPARPAWADRWLQLIVPPTERDGTP